MARPRIILADTDVQYLLSIQLKFVEEFFEKIDLEIITDRSYYNQLFESPQKAEVLIISEELYSMDIRKHNIGKVFLLTEEQEEDGTDDLNVEKIFKYSSIQGIFNAIVGKSGSIINIESEGKKSPQIIVVTSAAGGAGKTTVAMGMAACLSQNYKKVLYINCGYLQSFGYMLKNPSVISCNEVYSKISRNNVRAYSELQHIIRQEMFSYLPPFKASLISLGISAEIFIQIAEQAKASENYDYIILDTDSVFDSVKTEMLTVADKVVLVTGQDRASILSTNIMIKNINGMSNDKFLFVCNDFNTEASNYFASPEEHKFTVSEYINHIVNYDTMKGSDFAEQMSLKKVALLVE